MPLKLSRLPFAVAVVALALASATIYWVQSRELLAFSEPLPQPASEVDTTGAHPASDDSGGPAADSSSATVGRPSIGALSDASRLAAQPAAILSGDGPFIDRLLAGAATYGLNDYRVRRAAMYANSLCKRPDPSGSLALPLPDPSRDWALEAIAEMCTSLRSLQVDPSIPMIGEPESLLSIERSRGPDAAVAAAEEQMAREYDPLLVGEAALFAWEKGRAPSPRSMGIDPSSVGPVEMMAAISDAAQLASCLRAGNCGPSSLQTLAFCVRFGCAQGSSFGAALRAHHSEQRMRLIEGYAQWIQGFPGG